MRRKTSAKTFLRSTKKEQQVELITSTYLNIPDDDFDNDPILEKSVYMGPAKNIPKEYETSTISAWGIYHKNTVSLILDINF